MLHISGNNAGEGETRCNAASGRPAPECRVKLHEHPLLVMAKKAILFLDPVRSSVFLRRPMLRIPAANHPKRNDYRFS